MNSIDKVILLSEYFGIDVSNFQNSYHYYIVNGKTMDKLQSNIDEMQKYDNARIDALIRDYEILMKEKPSTFEDEVIFNAKVNYLCGISYEQYYLNPFAIGTNETTTKSLGELMLRFDGKYVSINDIILNTEHSLKNKSRAIGQQVNLYHTEMIKILKKPISEIKKSKNIDDKSVKHSHLGYFFIDLIFLLENLYLFLLLFFDGHVFANAIRFRVDNIYSYAFYLPFLSVAFFDVFFVIANCFRKRDQESYYFAKRYLDFSSRKVFNTLAGEAVRLYRYLMDAVKNRKILTDDIKKFSKVGGDELDLYGLMSVKSKRDTRSFRLVTTLRTIFLTLSVMTVIFSIALFLLQHFGLLGNIAI